jgi:hypothetical protein
MIYPMKNSFAFLTTIQKEKSSRCTCSLGIGYGGVHYGKDD